jgi:hypothetical protein
VTSSTNKWIAEVEKLEGIIKELQLEIVGLRLSRDNWKAMYTELLPRKPKTT